MCSLTYFPISKSFVSCKSFNGLIEVSYTDAFYDSVAFKDAIIKAFNKYEGGNQIFK